MRQELAQRFLVLLLGRDERVVTLTNLSEHFLRKQVLRQHFLVHQVLTDGVAHSLSNAETLLRNDAWRERNTLAKDVFRLMRSEHHADSQIVGDVTNDATHEWAQQIG